MDLLITGRQMGKTEQLVQRMKQHKDAILLVHNWNEAVRISEQYEIPENRIINAHSALQGALRGRTRSSLVLIDNLDMILDQLFGPIELATMTRSGQVYMYGPSD